MTVTELRFDEDGSVYSGTPSFQPPDYVPADWFATASESLVQHDNDAGKGFRDESEINRLSHEQLKARLTMSPVRNDASPTSDNLNLTTKVFGTTSSTARIIVKQERAIVGRLLLSDAILLMVDEADRWAVTTLLENRGQRVRHPLRGWGPRPAVQLALDWVESWAVFKVTESSFGLVLGLYFPSEQALLTANPAWDEPAKTALERAGLTVGTSLDGHVPIGYDGRLLEKLTTDLSPYVSSASARSSASLLPPAVPLPRTSVRLPADVAAAVPESVVELLQQGLPWPPKLHTLRSGRAWWTHRTSVLNRSHLATLRRSVSNVDVPKQALEATRWAEAIAPSHAALLASIRLRALAPDWFAALPWVDGPRQQRGARPGVHQQLLSDVTPQQAPGTGQPGLISALHDGALPLPDWPKWIEVDQDLQARLYIAAAALSHAKMVDGTATLKRVRCIECDSSFYVSGLSLEQVQFSASGQYCPPCTNGALEGVNPTNTSLERQAALDAIRVLADQAGGPPSRMMLRGSLYGLNDSERLGTLALRQALPAITSSTKSWTQWLADAGVLTDGWRPSYGIYSVATDGHSCRSLFERSIDDWLSVRAIRHEVEPSYPFDPDLNTTGLRADWLIDGVFVEAAGMMNTASYATKMEIKMQLAEKFGVELVVVKPADLDKLEVVFARWL